MSSTAVCHQELLQPCVESHVRLQLIPPRPTLDPLPESVEPSRNNPIDKNSWSFLQALNIPKTETTRKETEVYVHPLTKRSGSSLSPRSLAMCTESLGSETGCDDDMAFPLLQINHIPLLDEKTNNPSKKQDTSSEKESTLKPKRLMNRSVNVAGGFPPPLNSISGSNGVKFQPHREGGRLLLKAVPVASPVNYFEAERGDGRLRLRLTTNMPVQSADFIPDKVEEEEEEEEEEEVVVVVVDETMEEAEGETCWETEEEETSEIIVVGEMGMEKKVRLSRCKERRRGSNKMVMYWPPESFWVAT